MEKLNRAGWRFFECGECGFNWAWPSRDRLSTSGENCPKCGEWEFPHNSEADENLPTDKMGNLTINWNTTKEEFYD